MKLIKDKQKEKELTAKFKEINKDIKWSLYGFTFKDIRRMIWWGWFKKHRMIFFMQRVVDGMQIKFAWEDANEYTDKEIYNVLTHSGWVR